MKRLSLFVAIFALVAAGCGGSGGGSSNPALAPALTAGSATILIPNRAPESTARGARFVSASVVSAKMSIASLADQIFDLSSTSNRCTSVSGGRSCTIGFNAPLGQQTITLTLYDGANATGNALGVSQQGFSFSTQGANNLNFTVNGNVAAMAVSLVFQPGNPTNAFVVGQSNAASVFVIAKDADGNTIVAPGNYNQPATITNSDTTGAFTLSGNPTVNGPNTGPVLNYNGKAVGAVTIGATATGVSGTSITPAVIFGGTTPPPTATSPATATATPTAAVTPTPAPAVTSLPAPGQNCTAPALGPGAWTSFFSLGTVTGNVYTFNSANSSWVKFNYAGAATPVPSATSSTPGPSGGSQAVNVYFGTYTLAQGTTGCAILAASTDGSPISLFSSSGSFSGIAIGAPNVNAAATTLAASGTIAALTVTLNGSSGTGTVTLSNGDTGTITVGGMVTINIPAGSSSPGPSPTLGPVIVTPNFLTFTAPNQTQIATATQAGNGTSTFTFTPVSCPGPGSGSISQPTNGVFQVTSLTTSSGQTCSSTITGLSGRSAPLNMTF